MSFPQLNTISAYSLLSSTIQIPQLVAAAKAQGYQTLGLTDRNVLTGAVEFFQACQKQQLKPIIGLHLDYYSPLQEAENELLLFAKNAAGYQRLIALSSEKMITGQVTLEQFGPLTDLIAILPLRNELAFLLYNDATTAQNRAQELQTLFAGEIYYGIPPEVEVVAAEWFATQGIRPCALTPVNALTEAELPAIKVMDHLKNGTQLEDYREIIPDDGSYLRSEAAIAAYFTENSPQALANAEAIAANCEFLLPLQQKLLPHYPVEGQTAAEYLAKLCWQGLPQRVSQVTEEYQRRLEYELQVIHQMGFDDYFLIVWDVMAFAHQQKIVTGAGRGSAAGSLVAYVLAITDVDPIEYDLLFERFLNPERYTMPDIDLDIPDNRREEVLHYVQQKYGTFQMAQIATFGTMAAKMVLRDVARVFGLSQSEANRWSKAIPKALKITLRQAYDESPQLRELVGLSEKNERLFSIAQTLEGLPRHVSTHAAGVVISDQDLLNLIPLQAGSNDILLTQFTMGAVEAVGLLKMDFLGLRNLAIIDYTLKNIQRVYHQEFSQKAIPLDDPATLALFQAGDTAGIFQFESAGIRNVLRRLHPENIEDVAAVNALYRPGPQQNIDHFIKRKKGQEKITYPDPSLAPILKNTYGIMVYQEQIMQVAAKMAGFSLGQADILRRAISKKKKAVLDEERRNFVFGAMAKGYTKVKADEVYDYIERFADYGFNRSHAFAYSFVAFQMAFLKVHYAGAFFTALLNSVEKGSKVKEYLAEARRRKIKLLPPAINHSYYYFRLAAPDQIRFGIGGIKGVRRDFINQILAERKANGAFTSFDQFLYRIDPKWLKEELIRPLIEVGAFDELVSNRRQLSTELAGKLQNIALSGGSLDLLEVMTLKVKDIRDYTLEEKLELEEQYLDVYLSGHPTEPFTKLQQAKGVKLVTEFIPNEDVHFLLYVRNIREIRTKKGEQMAFLEGSDATGEIAVTIFPELYRQLRQKFQLNDVLYIEGKTEVSKYNGELQVIARKAVKATEIDRELSSVTCYLRIDEAHNNEKTLNELANLLKSHLGNIPVILYYTQTKETRLLSEDNWISSEKDLKKHLAKLLESQNVVFK